MIWLMFSVWDAVVLEFTCSGKSTCAFGKFTCLVNLVNNLPARVNLLVLFCKRKGTEFITLTCVTCLLHASLLGPGATEMN